MFLGKTFNSHSASLHLGVKLGTSKFNAGSTRDGVTSIPGRSTKIPSHFMLQCTEIGMSSGLMGHLARIQTLLLPYKHQP